MTPKELMADLRLCGSPTLAVAFCLIAERVHLVEFENGSHVRDASDCKQLLIELAAAAAPSAVFEHVPDYCPRCGHVHDGRECGADIGGGRRCRCELEGVPA